MDVAKYSRSTHCIVGIQKIFMVLPNIMTYDDTDACRQLHVHNTLTRPMIPSLAADHAPFGRWLSGYSLQLCYYYHMNWV